MNTEKRTASEDISKRHNIYASHIEMNIYQNKYSLHQANIILKFIADNNVVEMLDLFFIKIPR